MKKTFEALRVLAVASTILLMAAGCNSQAPQNPQPTPTPAQTQSSVNDISYQGQDGLTALQLLKAKYNVQTKTYSGLGEMVTSINGLAADNTHFWEFFVNGKSSDVGADSYKTKNSDTLEWKYSLISNSNQ